MAEHGQRVKAATNAATLGDLKALVSDLQTANAPVQLPHLNKPRVPGLAGGGGAGDARRRRGGAGAAGGGYRLGALRQHPSPFNFTSDPGAKADGVAPVVLTPPRQLQSLGGLNGLLEQMKKKFGDTMGYRLVIYPDYASLDRPDPGDDRRTLNYSYRGGWDDPTASPKSPDATPVDLSKFDAKAVVGVLRGGAGDVEHQARRREEHLSDRRAEPRSDRPRHPVGGDLRFERLRQRLHLARW